MAIQKRGLKTIKDILESTNKVKGYGSDSLGKKKFGAVYAYNKVVKIKPKSSVIEISMMIKGVTDKIWSQGKKRPVEAHRVRMAIHGVEQEDVSADEIVARIRTANANYADTNTYSRDDILELIREGKVNFFPGKTVFEAEKRVTVEVVEENGVTVRKSKNISTYAIVNNKISTDCYMKIWCSCSSYYWTFQWYNVENNVDITGRRMQSYQSVKGASTKLGMKNPGHNYGMCKHLLLLLAMLMDEEVIAEATGKGNPATVLKMNMSRFLMLDNISEEQFKNLMRLYTADYRAKQKQRRLRSWEPKKRKSNFAQKQTKNFTPYKNEFGKGNRK